MQQLEKELIYVCSPYRGEVRRNKEYARELVRTALDNGFVPVAAHLYLTEVLDDDNAEERSLGMEAGRGIMERCRYILVGTRYGISEGMKEEITLAALKGMVMMQEMQGNLYLEGKVKWERGRTTGRTQKEIETKEEFCKRFKQHINRSGAPELLGWMGGNGFFSVPASSKYHGAEPGGLARHSLNVFYKLADLARRDKRRKFDMESVAVAGLLHDLCKIDAYRIEDGGNGYEVTKNFPVGHGEKSVIMAMRFMRMTDEEIMAIRWHMGAYDFYARGGGYDLDNAFGKCPLAVMLHIADMMVTHLDETGE